MKPIINPWLFYFIDKAEDLACPLTVVGILFWIGSLLLFGLIFEDDGSDNARQLWKSLKVPRIFITIGLIIALLVPSKETSYKMLAASMVTPNNITAVGETAEDIIDYIVESVDTLLEKEDE